jgi:hypothetical protein
MKASVSPGANPLSQRTIGGSGAAGALDAADRCYRWDGGRLLRSRCAPCASIGPV